MDDNGGVIQVVMTPALRQAFEAWLARSGHFIAAPAPLHRRIAECYVSTEELLQLELGERVADLWERADMAMFFTAPQFRPEFYAIMLMIWVRNSADRHGRKYPKAWR